MAGESCGKSGNCLIDFGIADMAMRDEAQRTWIGGTDRDTAGLEFIRPLCGAAAGMAYTDPHDIGLDFRLISEQGINGMETRSQPFCAGVVFVQALDHRFERNDTGSSD